MFCCWRFISDEALAFSLATWTAMLIVFGHFPSGNCTTSCLWSSTSTSAQKFFQFPLKVFFSLILPVMSLWVATNFEKSRNKCFFWVNFTLLYRGILYRYSKIWRSSSSHPHLTGSGCRLFKAGWIQIDEETRRCAYELSKIFEKRLEISKIKKHTILTKRLKKPLLLFADL